MMNMYMKMMEGLGFEITNESKTILGMEVIEAKMETKGGTIEVICGKNGTARVDKPNGSHKWYYEKTSAQLRVALKQIIDYWNF